MKMIWMILLGGGMAVASPLENFVARAKIDQGPIGEKAAQFLVEHMVPKDRENLTEDFLIENLNLAFKARQEFPWAAKVPEEIFFNDVLPYAVFDETREAWRAEFLEMARPIVKDAKNASEAVQALNREFFNRVQVHYNTGRKAPNQSPKESMQIGKASCTGLSIILVNACRAVGIPARAVGTPRWLNDRGNHTWVEIWDGDWHFTGADEYDPQGLDRGWFTGDAARAKADEPQHAIYASSWKRDGLTFPLVWAKQSQEVAAIDRTAYYTQSTSADKHSTGLGVRLWDRKGGQRSVAQVHVIASDSFYGNGVTKGGTSDLNDLPRFAIQPGATGTVLLTLGTESREFAFGPLGQIDSTVDAVWSELAECSAGISAVLRSLQDSATDPTALEIPLSKVDAEKARQLLVGSLISRLATERKAEMEKKEIVLGDQTMPWLEKTFGAAPAKGHSLWISMHGGGNTRAEVNDSQWQNQIRLYELAEGIYIAPRAPTNTWNLWHEAHIDPMFQRLIEDYVVLRGVNPDQVYLMGYSAGGDGVWQLAPRMADRFAAAAMMAGHPNEASMLGLRNLPFAIFMGGDDAAYNRNKLASEKSAELDSLKKADPSGYSHLTRIYPGLGHWMNRKDAEAVPWMAQYTRNAWPDKIVWVQDDITHDRFYWLKIPDKTRAKAGDKIIATVEGQSIRMEDEVPSGTSLRLSDELIHLDQEVQVFVNGSLIHQGKIPRTAEAIRTTLAEQVDPPAAATAIFKVP